MHSNTKGVGMTTRDQGPPAESSVRRGRSSIGFPYYPLGDAVEVITVLFGHVGTGTASVDQVAAWLGHTTVNSGAFRLRLAGARKFGLLEAVHGGVRVTPLGRAVLERDTASEALVEAFLAVPLYRAVFEQYRGHALPPDQALERQMTAMGVIATQADKARQAFQRSAETAGFFRQGRQRLVRPAVSEVKVADRAVASDQSSVERTPSAPLEAAASDNERHPFIEGLLTSLPPPGTVWSKEDRQKWLNTADSIFALLFRDAD